MDTKYLFEMMISYKAELSAIGGAILGAIVGGAFTARAVSRQTYKQIKSAVELQKEVHQREIKINLYSRLNNRIADLFDIAADIDSAIRVSTDFVGQEFERLGPEGTGQVFGIQSPFEINDKFFLYDQAVTNIAIEIEGFEIIHPHLNVFRYAFLSHMHNLRMKKQNFYDFYLTLGLFNDFDENQQKILCLSKPLSNDIINQLRLLVMEYEEATTMVSCCAMDFRVEMQNHLLGEIFEHKIEHRKPIDEKYFVHSLDGESASKLLKYFTEESEWGKHCKSQEEKAQKIYLSQSN